MLRKIMVVLLALAPALVGCEMNIHENGKPDVIVKDTPSQVNVKPPDVNVSSKPSNVDVNVRR